MGLSPAGRGLETLLLGLIVGEWRQSMLSLMNQIAFDGLEDVLV